MTRRNAEFLSCVPMPGGFRVRRQVRRAAPYSNVHRASSAQSSPPQSIRSVHRYSSHVGNTR